MRIEISRKNWTRCLASEIEKSEDGDVIVCHTTAMMEMAESAKSRMCPNKAVSFEVDEKSGL